MGLCFLAVPLLGYLHFTGRIGFILMCQLIVSVESTTYEASPTLETQINELLLKVKFVPHYKHHKVG